MVIKTGKTHDKAEIKAQRNDLVQNYFGNYILEDVDFVNVSPSRIRFTDDEEWEDIISKWEDKGIWNYDMFDNHCDALHGLEDTMWSAVGTPIQIFEETRFNADVFDIRVGDVPLNELDIDDVRDAFWSENGDRLASRGWAIEETYNYCKKDVNLEDSEELRDVALDYGRLQLELVNLGYGEHEENENYMSLSCLATMRWSELPSLTLKTEALVIFLSITLAACYIRMTTTWATTALSMTMTSLPMTKDLMTWTLTLKILLNFT